MTKKTPSDSYAAEIKALVDLADDEINTDDIPEISAEKWLHVQRGDLYRPVKKAVTIRLDADVIDWFKAHARSGGYQTEINRILRAHVVVSEQKNG